MPPKPRLVLADDHRPFLDSVQRLLAPVFDIVGVADNGQKALELAVRLRPDVVVLDVAMPELNGFQTLELLKRDCPGTKVVFLTMHAEDDFVVAAINAGAHGYVLKSRLHLDLIGAINHALAERLVAPSLTSLSSVAGNGHIVQFHSNDSDYQDEVSRLVAATLRSGEQVVMLANEVTRIGVAQRLEARRVNLAQFADRGHYLARDSAQALSQVLVAGVPDRGRVAEIADAFDRFRLAGPKGPEGRLTIFADTSGSLHRNGHADAACKLERIWNELTNPLPFFTVCSYEAGCFEHADAFAHLASVCAAHSAVTSGASAQRSLDIN